MSVVNQMLRDLQSQQQSTKPLPLDLNPAGPVNPQQSSWQKFVVAFLILASVAALYYLMLVDYSKEATEQPIANQDLFAESNNQIASSVVEPVLTSKIDLQSNPGGVITMAKATAERVELAQKKFEEQVNPLTTTGQQQQPPKQQQDHIEITSLPANIALNPRKSVPEIKPRVALTNNSNQQVTNKAEMLTGDRANAPVKLASKSDSNTSRTKTIAKVNPAMPSSEMKTFTKTTQLNKSLQDIQSNAALFGLQQTKQSLAVLLNQHPDFHAARLYLIKSSWIAKDPETQAIIENATTLYPQQSAFKLAAARFYLENNQLQQAENLLQNLSVDDSETLELVQMRAVIRQKLNKHQLAVADYVFILRKSPDRGDIYLALGISLQALGQQQQALQSYKKALKDRQLSTRQKQFIKSKIEFYQG